MDDNCTDRYQEAMDKLWFCQNILLFDPDELTLRASSCTTSTLTEKRNPSKAADYWSEVDQIGYCNQTALSLSCSKQPLVEFQPPPRGRISSHPSSPPLSAIPQPKNRRRMRSCKSPSELESYEQKGFMDLGFEFQREELSPQIIRMLPRLQRLGEQGDGSEENRENDVKTVRKPSLGRLAWK